MRSVLLLIVSAIAVFALGCSAHGVGSSGDGDESDGPLVGSDDSSAGNTSESLTAGQTLTTTANLNLRKGAGTTYAVIVVIPAGTSVKLVSATAQNGFLNISWSGNTGW